VKVLVIGIGNRLRQDDAFGPIVAEELEKQLDDPRVEVRECAGLTPELAENVSKAEHVLFIDASADIAPGFLEHRELYRGTNPDMSLVHFLSPEALIEWTARLYNSSPRAEIWLMGAVETGLSEQLTPAVAAKVPEVVQQLLSRIVQLMSAH
jgi:hydrogenase maturation protease